MSAVLERKTYATLLNEVLLSCEWRETLVQGRPAGKRKVKPSTVSEVLLERDLDAQHKRIMTEALKGVA
jgi:hypothetical protein